MSRIDGIVAIVGRPNVGKSTLFNRLTRSDAAIVDDRPGVTRDRLYGNVWLDDDKEDGFALIDTGGFETDDCKYQPFSENLVWKQTEAAIAEADMIVLLLDAKSGLHQHDEELLRYLEKLNKPYLAVVNKIDGPEQQALMWEFFKLGFDDLHKVSAAHNRGVIDLKELVFEKLRELPDRRRGVDTDGSTKIAIVGRPNAGKSSILNRLTGQERALVSEIAGTTRDTVDTPLVFNKQKFLLIDTAGIRRKSKVSERLESLSVMRSIRAIERADVVLLIIDAEQGLTEQDARLASLAADRHRPIAIVVNKWDLIKEKNSNSAKIYAERLYDHLQTLSFAPIIFVSCLENQRVHKLLGMAERLAERAALRVETSKVNAALRQMVQEHTPALIKGKTRRVKFYYATQVAVNAPTIVIFCNVYNEIQESYIRYMKNRFRAMLGFDEIPIRLIFRPKEDTRKGRDRMIGLNRQGDAAYVAKDLDEEMGAKNQARKEMEDANQEPLFDEDVDYEGDFEDLDDETGEVHA